MVFGLANPDSIFGKRRYVLSDPLALEEVIKRCSILKTIDRVHFINIPEGSDSDSDSDDDSNLNSGSDSDLRYNH